LPGFKKGTRIRFKNEGDEAPGIIAPDVVVEINEIPHSRFKRDGNDLLYTSTITLLQALTGCSVEIVCSCDVNGVLTFFCCSLFFILTANFG